MVLELAAPAFIRPLFSLAGPASRSSARGEVGETGGAPSDTQRSFVLPTPRQLYNGLGAGEGIGAQVSNWPPAPEFAVT